jgi:hypothetical protein
VASRIPFIISAMHRTSAQHTTFVDFSAGFIHVICRLTRQTDLTVGLAHALRNSALEQDIIGNFLNMAVVGANIPQPQSCTMESAAAAV